MAYERALYMVYEEGETGGCFETRDLAEAVEFAVKGVSTRVVVERSGGDCSIRHIGIPEDSDETGARLGRIEARLDDLDSSVEELLDLSRAALSACERAAAGFDHPEADAEERDR